MNNQPENTISPEEKDISDIIKNTQTPKGVKEESLTITQITHEQRFKETYTLYEAEQRLRKNDIETSHHVYSMTIDSKGNKIFINLANKPMNSYKEINDAFNQYKEHRTIIITKGLIDIQDPNGNHISNMIMGG